MSPASLSSHQPKLTRLFFPVFKPQLDTHPPPHCFCFLDIIQEIYFFLFYFFLFCFLFGGYSKTKRWMAQLLLLTGLHVAQCWFEQDCCFVSCRPGLYNRPYRLLSRAHFMALIMTLGVNPLSTNLPSIPSSFIWRSPRLESHLFDLTDIWPSF